MLYPKKTEIKTEDKRDPYDLECVFCGCKFASYNDYSAHMDAFGPDQQEHMRKFNALHHGYRWQIQ